MSATKQRNTDSQVAIRLKSMAAGSFAGGFAKTCTNPFERVKILCQAGKTPNPISAAKLVWSQEGIAGFWRGNAASLLRIVPNRGVLFMCSDFFKDMMRGFPDHNAPLVPLSGLQYVAAGSMSGAVTVICTYPLDLIRGRLTGSIGTQNRYTGIIQTFRLTLQEEGFRKLYRGMGTSLFGAFPYEGIRFGVYDSLKSNYLHEKSPIYMNVFIGAISGLTAATVMYPNDTVRRRMQVQFKSKSGETGSIITNGIDGNDKHYKNGWDCYKTLYKKHGLGIFYRGLTANIVRAVPSAALQFGSFEFLKRHLNIKK